ncbi:MAG: PHP domain-containing protein [Oscillospiraceae bacterium]|nr:PHP domain-containing protein [Oscillospiraceae bacterium]
MEEYCDLHTHSHYSDGSDSPAEVIRKAKKMGLCAIALTDHNTVAGLPEFMESARERHIQAIPGVEISAGYQGKELHIVGLFLPMNRLDEIQPFLDSILRRKEESNHRLVENLARAGYPIDYGFLLESHPTGNINRAGIATAMLKKGYISSRDEAFQGILHPEKGIYQPPEQICVFEAIGFLAAFGAVSVLAHPFLKLSEPELREFLPVAMQYGLSAMETMYSTFSPAQTTLAREIAQAYGLKESGGSDFHGTVKPGIRLGIGKGDLAVPMEFARNLNPDFSK